ncbi:DUF4350 domain-containing protein [uncultured Microbulbifer sp.]|uniref:DUF4350 domain-containing protein n=1 Tax=uncultured Microbulbifer sp. TaxID=348147 RepID=UPI00261322B0|nr:DUF4350 domain-containing protein [uncultured Microbulbifer sp.]
MKLSRIAIVWTLLLLTAACTLFLYFFERHTEEVDLGFGPEARRNPFLAAQQFLDQLDIHHRRADNISIVSTLDDGDALFLASSSQVYNQDRLRELLDWIEAGGHAIVIAHRGDGDNEQDLLLATLGLEVTNGDLDLYFNRQVREVFGEDASDLQGKTASEMMRDHNRKLAEEESSGEAPAVSDDNETAEESAPRNPDVDPERLVNLTSDSGASYALYFDPGKVFTHEMMGQGTDVDRDADVDGNPLHWVPFQKISTQSPLVYYERGRGRMTLMTDGGLWRNDRIGEFDHAYFLAHLVGERALVMITQPRFDTLGTLIQRYTLELFFAGLLALIAWIANRSRRFGPMAPPAASERRSLMEHIRACGHFYWRQNRAVLLFDQARKPLLKKLVRNRQPGAERQIAQSIAEKTGLSAQEIFDTLWAPAPIHQDDFTARLRSIQIIEAAL